MKINAMIQCPYCNTEHNLYNEDNWDDDFMENYHNHVFICPKCVKKLSIETKVTLELVIDRKETERINEKYFLNQNEN